MKTHRASLMMGIFLFVVVALLPTWASARAMQKEQTLYVPAYSYIYHGNKEAKIKLTTTLSVRNTSRTESIRIVSVDYYDTDGKLLRSYVKEPVVMKPLQSLRYIVSLDDEEGGSGANFVLKWEADKAVDVPIIESIMLGTGSSYGFSFLTQGVPIE
ncbi:DUF3124 domain-containing protein [Halodesulfovibrio aestuarii]|uniref:DUF3124 domain-containing protein n=1 Tax=Halodesulfovibrio aestuarii TaxID=126333 RepID=A0A8G2F9R6_9BACT|nr:DUF3124 domain-containing protein [Halodesulfovibrio aestuarii]SHJ49040.1 Protein of unknown function [Halodesulfovibrio aestuarii]